MPLLGFGGYLPFGMEYAAVAAWISTKLIERFKWRTTVPLCQKSLGKSPNSL